MAVESDEDLASFFLEDEFASPARYTAPTPAAAALDCTVIYDRGQGGPTLEDARHTAAGMERQVQAYKIELPQIERGGLFEILDGAEPPAVVETLRVAGMPRLDKTGRWWSVDVTIVN